MKRTILFAFLLFFSMRPSVAEVYINEIMASNSRTILDPDSLQYADWIEIYNSGPFTVDLGGAYLSDDPAQPLKWRIPAGTAVPAGGFLLVWADGSDAALKGLHTNFKLNNGGESVGLFAPDGTVVDTLSFGKQSRDVSYGRAPDEPKRFLFYEEPTPGGPNVTVGLPVREEAGEVSFSLAPGFYRGPQILTLTASPSAVIRYTLDGSTPTRSSKVYQGPIAVTRSLVVKARAFEPARLPGPVATCTLFIDEAVTLPVFSLAADPADLFSDEKGFYNDKSIDKRRNWERPATIEFFETDGSRQFSAKVDVRLFGRTAIYIPQKSLALFLDKTLQYPLFPGRPVQEFDSFILRSSSDDWHRTLFRDGYIQTLLSRCLSVDTQAYRPAVLFINGEYFGIHNIREKYNGAYLATHHGVDADNVDVLYIDERQADPVTVLEGDRQHYDALIDFIAKNSLADPANYQTVAAQVDIDNFIDYVIAEAFTGNTSWAHNIRCWRPRTPDGKWQWLLFDMDRGFRDRNFNALSDMAAKFELFKALLENEEFRNRFVRRYIDLLNDDFRPEHTTPLLDSLQAAIAPEMPNHIARWKDHCGNGVCGIASMNDWQNYVSDMRRIVQDRPAIALQQLQSFFNVDRAVILNVQIMQPGYGEVVIGGRTRAERGFDGNYFPDMTVELEAKPYPGFSFNGWYQSAASETVLLGRGSTWRYYDLGVAPDAGWVTGGFDDSAWKSGRAQFGYGENDEATVIEYGPDAAHKYMTAYFRTRFSVDDAGAVKQVVFRLLRDDGAVVFLNGSELFRSNMPQGPINFNTPASSAVGGADESTFFEYIFPGSVLKNGENLVAVEVHQSGGSSSDLSFDLEIAATLAGTGGQALSTEPKLSLKMLKDYQLTAAFAPESARLLPSTIASSMRLNAAGSPYLALGNVTVAADASLTLEAGVELLFAEDASLIVSGLLRAEGSETAPTVLRGISGRWGALCFDHAAGPSLLRHVRIDGATVGHDAARFIAAISAVHSELTLDHVSFTRVGQPFNAVGGSAVLTHCVLDGTGAGDDILHAADASMRIEYCRLFGNGELDFDSVDNGIIRHNIIEIISDNSNRDGIDIGASKNVLIENNRIFNCPDKGISVGEKSMGTVIRGNLVVNASMGVAVKDSSEALIDHNTFYNAFSGVSLYEKVSGEGGGTAVISNCIFAGNYHEEISAEDQSSVQVSYSLAEKRLLAGVGNLKADPLFVSPQAGDFTLRIDSPAIDAGDPAAPLDADGTRSDMGAFPFYFGPADVSGLYINEIMAANASSADEAGEFDDWFEIYNAGEVDVDLGGLYLTDDFRNPLMWRIPTGTPEQTTVPAKGFLVFWADGSPAQGPRHVDFKLNADGERLALVKATRTQVLFVDSLSFGPQPKDVAWGRFPDGSPLWMKMHKATPGDANMAYPEAVGDERKIPESFRVHQNSPNPFNPVTTVVYELPHSAVVTVEVFDALGRRVARLLQERKEAGVHRVEWQGADDHGTAMPSGVYFCRVTADDRSIVQKMMLLR